MFRTWRRPKLARAMRRWASFLSPASRPIRPSAINSTFQPTFRSHPRPYRDTIVWYATIISVAAALDVGVKQRRRSHWDTAIAQAEHALQISPDQARELKASILASHDLHPPETLNSPAEVEDEPSQVPSSNPLSAPSTRQHSPRSQFKDLLFQSSSHPTNKTFDRIPEPPPFSIYSTRSNAKKSTFTWTRKKYARSGYSVAKLCARLMDEAKPDSKQQRELSERLRQSIDTRLRSTRHVDANDADELETLEFPQYELLDPSLVDHQQRELCNSIINVIDKYIAGKHDRTSMLQKIAHNLMISNTPPNTIIYSTMISRFSRLNFYNLANAVIKSMQESNIRHDEVSVSIMLAHYLRQASYKPFHHLVRQLQGFEGGLMLADPKLLEPHPELDTLSNPTLQEINPNSHDLAVRIHGEKLIQKILINERIAYQIVRGYLFFDKTKAVLAWLKAIRRLGLFIDIRYANLLLRHAVKRKNWPEVYQIWRQVYIHLPEPIAMDYIDRCHEQRAFYYVLKASVQQRRFILFRFHLRLAHSRGWTVSSLKRPVNLHRKFGPKADYFERRERNFHILKHRLAIVADIVRYIAIQLLGLIHIKVSEASLKIIKHKPSPRRHRLETNLKTHEISLVRTVDSSTSPEASLSHPTSDQKFSQADSTLPMNLRVRRSYKVPTQPRIRTVKAFRRGITNDTAAKSAKIPAQGADSDSRPEKIPIENLSGYPADKWRDITDKKSKRWPRPRVISYI